MAEQRPDSPPPATETDHLRVPDASDRHGSTSYASTVEYYDGKPSPPQSPNPQRGLLSPVFGNKKAAPDRDGEKGGQSRSERRPQCCGCIPLPRSRALRVLLIIAIALLLLLVILLSTLLTLLPREHDAAPAYPAEEFDMDSVVDVSYGQYEGVALQNGITQWLGMRYAHAPTGDYRFAAPAPPANFTGIKRANHTIEGCSGIGPNGNKTNEDCLSIDVYAPSTATNTSNLPVFVFIQGGGLLGATDHPNCSDLILAAGNNMVGVTMTYRVGPYGFLASSQLQANASLNNGYKDQRYALEWVQQHISKFGGNPNLVTLGGQSAGAGSVVGQMVAYGGDAGNLFHAAAIESQSLGPVRTVEEAQYQFDNLTDTLGCSDADDQIACLRAVPNAAFVDAVAMIPYPDGPGGAPVFPYNPVIDGDFLVNAPIAAFQEGSFARVPTIWGDVTDEGTIFTPRDISNEIETTTFLADNWPTMNASSFDEYATLYNLSSSSTPPNPFWYKASEAYGETRYICPGMQLPNLMRQNGFDQVWNYRFNVLDPQGVANGNYVSHGADVPALFGAVAGGPPSYSTTNKNIIPVMQGYWTSFIQTQDPNQLRASGTPEWQLWDGKSRLLLETNTTTMETVPSAQLQRCDFLAEISVGLDQ